MRTTRKSCRRHLEIISWTYASSFYSGLLDQDHGYFGYTPTFRDILSHLSFNDRRVAGHTRHRVNLGGSNCGTSEGLTDVLQALVLDPYQPYLASVTV